jgi:hypothetical protein
MANSTGPSIYMRQCIYRIISVSHGSTIVNAIILSSLDRPLNLTKLKKPEQYQALISGLCSSVLALVLLFSGMKYRTSLGFTIGEEVVPLRFPIPCPLFRNKRGTEDTGV